ncbi:MAG: glycine zipper domain-containing protein [Candidatus Omnitrophica bacterium]|jgi:hypothetical protein|nr:glycine zipper domain-containing protein [Candidatus Omnitrophota bacterium]
MKKIASFMMISVLILVSCLGCAENKTRVAEGAVAGGALGALAGGLLKGGTGAAVGAAIGATGGALVGAQIDKKPEQAEAAEVKTASDPNATQMSILQVIELSKQGTPDSVIIDKIKKSNSKFNLSLEDINYLKKQGMSDKVINVMRE